MNEDTKTYNGHTYSGNLLSACVNGYKQGIADGYNQALEDIIAKVKEHHYLLSDKINSTDYGMFTCGIEQVVDELKR